jgi:hypothetical protein
MYAPNIAEHVPGLENVVADMLSRRYVPNKDPPYQLPICLETVEETVLPDRNHEYFVTLQRPSESTTRKRR